MPWSLAAQASGSIQPKRQRTPRDRERDAQRPSKEARGYGRAWQTVRRKIILRDNKQCQQCGFDGYLVVHHIDHDPTNNDWANLTTLCRSCHEKLHGR